MKKLSWLSIAGSLFLGLGILVSSARAHAGTSDFVMLTYNFADGGNIMFPIGKFGIGASYGSGSASTTDSAGDKVSVALTQYKAKFGYWSNGIGTSSLYAIAGAGSGTVNATATLASNGSALSGNTNLSVVSGQLGYQWFWGAFTLHVGGQLYSYTIPAFSLNYTNTGALYQNISSFSSGGLGIDFGLGFAF